MIGIKHPQRRILITGPNPKLENGDAFAGGSQRLFGNEGMWTTARAFAVRELHTPRGLSVAVSQRVAKNGAVHAWDSVIVQCDEEPDGSLTTRIIISNPDWNERLQIACLRSCPDDADCLTALGCNLDHRRVDS